MMPSRVSTTVSLPYWTAELPGTGGALRQTPDDFQVVEVPAYEPSGEGEHVFAWIEKRDLTTPRAAELMAAALGVRTGDVGWAGMKDRHAVTRQLLSFPPPVRPEDMEKLQIEGISVIHARRHGNKLRAGHLRGNRFTLRVHDCEVAADDAAARAEAILSRLARPPGAPNWFGAQRFGREGDNAAHGRALLADPPGGGRGGKRRDRSADGRRRRMYISAYQSMLFNEFLRRRLDDGLYARVLLGDLLKKRESGGVFASAEPALDQARLEAGELAPTGPMFGHKLRVPPHDTPAAERELAVLADEDITLAAFKRVGKLGMGTRRPLAIPLDDHRVAAIGDRTIEISFALPAGSYATAVMREVVKGPTDFPG